jgi:hypothetical protein
MADKTAVVAEMEDVLKKIYALEARLDVLEDQLEDDDLHDFYATHYSVNEP